MADRGKSATFRFYAELNDFLSRGRRFRDVSYRFSGAPSVKDAIEAIGVPHPEVELIVVDGRSVGFDHPLRSGARVAVYPMFEAIDVAGALRVRERPLRRTRFVIDTHLGTLARRLRLLGLDARYAREADDPEIVRIAVDEHRIVLTRDRGLLKRAAVTHGYCVRSDVPAEQVREVLDRFDLRDDLAPFTRCTTCNARLETVDKRDVAHRLGEATRREYDEFRRCPGCDRVYWRGTHFERLRREVARWTGERSDGPTPPEE